MEKHKEKVGKEKKKKKKIGLKIFLFILVILCIGAGVFAYKMHKNGGGLQGFMATALGHNEETLKNLPKIQFLVLGISGYDDYKLADTIIVCSYDPRTQSASMLSIPRDTYVGKSLNRVSASYKINSTFRNGENIEGMKEYVEELTGLEIPYYVVIDTNAVVKLVDEIGGVTFDVPRDMVYDDYSQDLHINLKKGVQLLNGKQAEGLLRYRKSNNGETYSSEYGSDDYGRMRTQREFITVAAKQILKVENIFKINNLVDIAYENVKTNMTLSDIKDYIPYAVNFNADNIKMGMLPGESTNENANGIWIYVQNKKESETLIKELFISNSEEFEDVENEEIKIEILNGSGVNSNLTKLKEELEKAGYKVTKTGNTSSTAKTTIINRTNKSETTINKLIDIIKIGKSSQGEDNSNVDFTIILGKDY